MTSHQHEQLYKNTEKNFKWINRDDSQQVEWALTYLSDKGIRIDENYYPTKYDALMACISTWAYEASQLKAMKNTWSQTLTRKNKVAKTQLNCTVSLYTKNQLASIAKRDKTTNGNALEKIIYEYGEMKSKFDKELKLQKAKIKESYDRSLASKELRFHKRTDWIGLNLSRLLELINGELSERHKYLILLEDNHIDQTLTDEQEQRAKDLQAEQGKINACLRLLEKMCKKKAKKEKKEKPKKQPKQSPKEKRE